MKMDASLYVQEARDVSQAMVDDEAFRWTLWAEAAQQLHGFEPRTAQRLAFFRWLHRTGRLTDG
jgi:methionine synthase II (cobalamin-independent)